MSRAVWISLIGVAVIGAGAGYLVHWSRGESLRLEGQIQKVRTLGTQPNISVLVIDFRVHNPSRHSYMVSSVEVLLDTASGVLHEGSFVSESDAVNVFKQYPALGEKYNETLVRRQQFAAGETLDRMVMAMYELPVEELDKRKGLRIRVRERDGNVSEIEERSR